MDSSNAKNGRYNRPKVDGPQLGQVDVESVSLKRQTVDGSIERQWTRQEDINWTVQKYMLTVRTTESNSIQRLRSKVDDQKIQNHHW